MKRLQVLVPDNIYESLQKEAARRQLTVADFVRRGIDRQLDSAIDIPYREPTLTPRDLGAPSLSTDSWREAANDRLSG
jgi:hypothetical protein